MTPVLARMRIVEVARAYSEAVAEGRSQSDLDLVLGALEQEAEAYNQACADHRIQPGTDLGTKIRAEYGIGW